MVHRLPEVVNTIKVDDRLKAATHGEPFLVTRRAPHGLPEGSGIVRLRERRDDPGGRVESMARPQVRYTYEDYRQLPDDGKRYEVLDGELVVSPAPSPRHQRVLTRLAYYLHGHVQVERRRGEVFVAPLDVILANDSVVQPDLLFVAEERRGALSARGLEGSPDLAIELLSPSTRLRDRTRKRELYARYGVRELWLVDPDQSTLEVLELAKGELAPARAFTAQDTLTSRVLPDLRLDLAAVFAP